LADRSRALPSLAVYLNRSAKGAGNPSPVWEKGRDEGLPYQIETAAAPSHFNDQRRALTPAPLPSGRGVPRAPIGFRTA